MPRPVVESTRVVIRTTEGNRLELNGKGNAAQSLAFAITFLNDERFNWVVAELAKEKARREAKG